MTESDGFPRRTRARTFRNRRAAGRALAAELSEELFLSQEQVNGAHLAALAWAQDVGTGSDVA